MAGTESQELDLLNEFLESESLYNSYDNHRYYQQRMNLQHGAIQQSLPEHYQQHPSSIQREMAHSSVRNDTRENERMGTQQGDPQLFLGNNSHFQSPSTHSQMRPSKRLLPYKKRISTVPKKIPQNKKREKPTLREFEKGKRIAEKLQPKIVCKLTEALNAHMEKINNLRYEITKIMSENMEKSESQKVECVACSKMLSRRGIQQHCSRYVYCFLCGSFELTGRDSCKNLAFVKNLTSIPLL